MRDRPGGVVLKVKDKFGVMTEVNIVLDQAIAWHLRLATADEADWLQFTEWLEASEAHAAAYDEVAMRDGLLGESEVLATVPTTGPLADPDDPPAEAGANDNLPLPSRGWRWLVGGASVAAAAVAAFALLPGLIAQGSPSLYETPDGVARSVALADGSRVELAGGSRLRIDASAPRVAVLERGEALFHVRHDATAPFTVKVSDVAVQDLGTVFSVAADRDAVRVAVAEGSVAVRRDRKQLTLGPGDTAQASVGKDALEAGRIAPGAVGSWRSRTLTFQGEPLSVVVERLNRLYALRLSLSANLSDRPFTGMVQLTGDAARDVPHLAALTGTSWRRDGEGWLLSSADSSRP